MNKESRSEPDIGQQVARRVQALRLRKGWSQADLAARAGISTEAIRDAEISCRNLSLGELAGIADALETTPGWLVPLGHPLEEEWRTDAWEVLSATERGFRAKVCVLGKLAEWKLHEEISALLESGAPLSKVVWNDSDSEPDFMLEWRGRPILIECKNVRRDREKPTRCRVELQKTRNSRDGSNTRGYPRDKFHVLAACLYNQTREWRFAFCATKNLVARKDDNTLLAIYHEIPSPTKSPWTETLNEALDEVHR